MTSLNNDETDWEKEVSEMMKTLLLDEISDVPDPEGELFPHKNWAEDWVTNIQLGSDSVDEDNMVTDQQVAIFNRLSKKDGFKVLIERINDINNAWKKIKINIAITGESGSGKSSFINAIRNVKYGDEGAAEIGCTETTIKPTPYAFKESKNVNIWDLPGVGTPKIPRETYLQEMNMEIYDFIILVSGSRFKENDAWLAKEIKSRYKESNLFFIRTKVDSDIYNLSIGSRKPIKTEDIEARIRKECRDYLTTEEIGNAEIFLINSYRTDAYDFEKFSSALLEKASELKREALILSLFSVSDAVVAEKIQILKKRIKGIAIKGSIVAVVSERINGTRLELSVLMKEVLFYKLQLAIDENSISLLAPILKISQESIHTELKMQSHIILRTEEEFAKFYDKYDTFRPRYFYKWGEFGRWLQRRKYQRQCTLVLEHLLEMCTSEKERLQNIFQKFKK